MNNHSPIRIDSSSNAKFKSWLELTYGKGLKNSDAFFLSGEKIIHEFLLNPAKWEIQTLISSSQLSDQAKHLKSLLPTSAAHFELSPELFLQLDLVGSHYPLLILKQSGIPEWDVDRPPQGLEVFLPLGDPKNLGSAIRTLKAFGASKIILMAESANIFHPHCVKASAGSLLNAPIFRGPPLNSIKDFKDFTALDLKGESLFSWKAPKNIRILVGEEGPGLPKAFNGKKIHIPMQPHLESLNAQTSLAILAYEFYKQNS